MLYCQIYNIIHSFDPLYHVSDIYLPNTVSTDIYLRYSYPTEPYSYSITLFTLSLTRPSPKLSSPVWPWPGEPSDLHWLGKSFIVGEISNLHLA